MKKLLIIEDDTDIVDIIECMFDDTDYEVVKFFEKISIEQIAEINPNIIILDYYLGTELGSDICLEIKANPITGHIPVVLYSALDNLKELALDSCADGYISKPFDLYEFLGVVDRLAL